MSTTGHHVNRFLVSKLSVFKSRVCPRCSRTFTFVFIVPPCVVSMKCSLVTCLRHYKHVLT